MTNQLPLPHSAKRSYDDRKRKLPASGFAKCPTGHGAYEMNAFLLFWGCPISCFTLSLKT
ncbi:hypothetical protein IAD21_02864 [Abditibacteriota bacterium]|nr:hypothetical protein IAD21_02864 [Abditibacteriota bacterium]